MALYRSRRHKILAGVCGGFADWLGWSPTLVRIAYLLLSVCSAGFPGTIVYILLWIFIRKAPKGPTAAEERPGAAQPPP